MSIQQIETAARQAEAARNWEEAYHNWNKLHSMTALLPNQLFCLARSATFSGHLDQAEGILNSIANSSVPRMQFVMLKADVAERRRDYETSLELRREAEAIDPKSYWAKFAIARVRNALKHPPEEVIAVMRSALSLPDAEKQGGLFAANLLARNGDFAAATELAARFVSDEQERETWEISVLPGMTSQRERRAARDLAQHVDGRGKIVDLGCWLGSLTASLVSGLKLNTNRSKPKNVIAYDRFVWEPSYMEPLWSGSAVGLNDGDDFLPWFRKIMDRWSQWIDARKVDLEKEAWTEGPISLLVVDAMKTPKLARQIMSAFYPSLLPNGHVFHQDFCHSGRAWWIHVYHFLVRDKFMVTDNIPGSGTVVFRLMEPITPEEIAKVLATDVTSQELAEQAFEYALSIVDHVDRPSILNVYATCEEQNCRPARAAEIRKRLAER